LLRSLFRSVSAMLSLSASLLHSVIANATLATYTLNEEPDWIFPFLPMDDDVDDDDW
jgi:hypothetical protein